MESSKDDYLIRGKTGLETALILSTDVQKFHGLVQRDYDMLEKLVEIVRLFEQNKIPFALIGGLAVGARSIPRATKDVDFIVDERDMDKARRLLSAYYKEGDTDFMLFDIEGVRLDLISARLRFQKRSLAEARPENVDGVRVPVVAARDLILLKLVAAGDRRNLRAASQDQTDIIGLIEHGKELTPQDFQYVARCILESFCFARESGLRYRELLRWLNETLDKLGRPECKVPPA